MALIRPIPTANAEMKEMLLLYYHRNTGNNYFLTNGSTNTDSSNPTVITSASEYITLSADNTSGTVVAKKACKARVLLGDINTGSSTYKDIECAIGDTVLTFPTVEGSFTVSTIEIF